MNLQQKNPAKNEIWMLILHYYLCSMKYKIAPPFNTYKFRPNTIIACIMDFYFHKNLKDSPIGSFPHSFKNEENGVDIFKLLQNFSLVHFLLSFFSLNDQRIIFRFVVLWHLIQVVIYYENDQRIIFRFVVLWHLIQVGIYYD